MQVSGLSGGSVEKRETAMFNYKYWSWRANQTPPERRVYRSRVIMQKSCALYYVNNNGWLHSPLGFWQQSKIQGRNPKTRARLVNAMLRLLPILFVIDIQIWSMSPTK
jgi:hypothetical protein